MTSMQAPDVHGADGGGHAIEEFLYMDPDTGMIVCMIADEDGFRPATAAQEMESLPARWFSEQPAATPNPERDSAWTDELSSLDAFVQNFEHAFLAPSAG